MSNYGFIITRHVNSKQTNKYWNNCVKLIRTHYPLRQIIIIDDNSNKEFVSSEFQYSNLTIIQSEFPGRGELLPYYYLLKYKWFPNAVIIHDSTFIHFKINFDKIKMPVIPLWHHNYDKENVNNVLRITSALSNNYQLIKKLNEKEEFIGNLSFSQKLILCFGSQCYIKLNFLEKIQSKYNITNLVHVIRNRPDRCSFERIIGALFCEEWPYLLKIKSLFGNIYSFPNSFNYTFDNYENDIRNKRIPRRVVKVWTGR